MKHLVRTFVVLAGLGAAGAAFADANWFGSWDQAAKAAKASRRPILVLFTGSDWCAPCHMLETQVFESPVFQKWAKDHVVLLKLDFPKRHPQPQAVAMANQKLAQQYQIDSFPTVIALSPNGQVLSKQKGYDPVGPTFWTKNLEYVMRAHSRG